MSRDDAAQARTHILQLQQQGRLQTTAIPDMFHFDRFKVLTLSEFDNKIVQKGKELALRIKEWLEQSDTGSLPERVVAEEVHKAEDPLWKCAFTKAGNCRGFCAKYKTILQYVSDAGGGGRIQAASSVAPKAALTLGARVRVHRNSPEDLWVDVFEWSEGRVQELSAVDGRVVVNFPEKSDWTGHVKDLVLARYPYPNLHDRRLEQSTYFDMHAFVQSISLGDSLRRRFRFTGITTQRKRQVAEYGFVHACHSLTPQNAFFQVRLISSNTNISVGLSESSFFAGNMVGWLRGSIGFHAHNKAVCYIDRGNCMSVQVQSEDFGEGDRIGCGVIFEENVAKTIYFTRNDSVIARCMLLGNESRMLHPVIAGSSPVEFEFLPAENGPKVDYACTSDMITYEAKYREDSFAFKPVYIQGVKTPDGKLPVVFYKDGYSEPVNVPWNRDRLRERKTVKHFFNVEEGFEYVFKFAKENAKMTISAQGTHIIRVSIDLSKRCTIEGGQSSNKPQLLCPSGSVFKVFDIAIMRYLQIRSVRAKEGEGIRNEMHSAVVLHNGSLAMESCNVSSALGYGVFMFKPVPGPGKRFKLGSLRIQDCQIGPCRASGVLVNVSNGAASMKHVHVEDTIENGVECKRGSEVTLEGCRFRECRKGIAAWHPESVDANNCVFQCREHAVLLEADHRAESNTCVRMKECSLNNCIVESRGARSNVVLESCTGVRPVEYFGGKVSQQQTSGPPNAQQDPPNLMAPKLNLQESSPSAIETGNFHTYAELVNSKGQKVLALLLMASFRQRNGRMLDKDGCRQIRDAVFNTKMVIHKVEISRIEQGNIQTWDVSLLRRLLEFVQCCMPYSSDSREKVILVADARNVHDHEVQEGKGSMTTEVFKNKFPPVYNALLSILANLSTCEFPECRAAPLLQELKEWHRREIETFQILKIDQVSPLYWKDVVDDEGYIELRKLPRGEYVVMLNDDDSRKYKIRTQGRDTTVFEAWRLPDERKLLLKVCKGIDEEYAKKEVKMLEMLSRKPHDNIMEFVDGFAHFRSYVVVTEHVEGISLKEWLPIIHSQPDRAPWREAKTFMQQFSDGMCVVHDCNIVHRNLQPSKLKLTPYGDGYILKIVDFGISKYLEKDRMHNMSSLQRIKAASKTNLYWSPELVRGALKKVCQATDVWSMGVILYELLTNTTPFGLSRHVDSTVRSVSEFDAGQIPQKIVLGFSTGVHDKAVETSLAREGPGIRHEAIVEVLKKCLTPDIKKRYQHARDLWAELQKAFDEMECTNVVNPNVQPTNHAATDEVCRSFVGACILSCVWSWNCQ
jgi:serine/threonine protein kinase